MGTIRKRGKKKWTGDYSDGAGQRRRFDVASKEEAARELARRTIESGQALPLALLNPNITVREHFGAVGSATTPATGWMAALGALVKPRTVASTRTWVGSMCYLRSATSKSARCIAPTSGRSS